MDSIVLMMMEVEGEVWKNKKKKKKKEEELKSGNNEEQEKYELTY